MGGHWLFLARMESMQAEVDFLTLTVDICEQFRQYFSSIYASKLQKSSADIAGFRARASLLSLSSEDRRELDSPIIEDEIQMAIGHMATRKSTGPDGFPVEWYKLNIEKYGACLGTLQVSSYQSVVAPSFGDSKREKAKSSNPV